MNLATKPIETRGQVLKDFRTKRGHSRRSFAAQTSKWIGGWSENVVRALEDHRTIFEDYRVEDLVEARWFPRVDPNKEENPHYRRFLDADPRGDNWITVRDTELEFIVQRAVLSALRQAGLFFKRIFSDKADEAYVEFLMRIVYWLVELIVRIRARLDDILTEIRIRLK